GVSADLLACELAGLEVDRLEGVSARLADLRPNELGDVELRVQLRVAAAPLIVRVARAVAVVLTHDEERRLDEEAEVAMLEGASMPIPHEEPDQPLVARAHLLRLLVERDPGAVDDGEVGGEGAVERDEAVVEDRDRLLGYHFGRDGHGSECNGALCRSLRILL